jgi:phosphatidylethanolamine/phosphatidyl-N-methylethanolamine N-methyltransferase
MKASTPKISRSEENLLFFKQLMKNPRSLGAVAPSSYKLADFICQHVPVDDNFIVEVGAGTGRLTQALLKSGLDPSHLAIVELDKDMCAFLKKNFPQVKVIQGNACELDTLLPLSWQGRVGTIISGIPMRNVSLDHHKLMVTSFLKVLKESGNILQFSYGPLSPLSVKKLGLKKKRLGHILLNIPPATIWQYSKGITEPFNIRTFKPRFTQFKMHIQSKLGDRK